MVVSKVMESVCLVRGLSWYSLIIAELSMGGAGTGGSWAKREVYDEIVIARNMYIFLNIKR